RDIPGGNSLQYLNISIFLFGGWSLVTWTTADKDAEQCPYQGSFHHLTPNVRETTKRALNLFDTELHFRGPAYGLRYHRQGLLLWHGCNGNERPRVRHIASSTSPSSTDVLSCGRSPLFHSAAVCTTRYLIGPPSGLPLLTMGRGMQTNSVRISRADKRTLA